MYVYTFVNFIVPKRLNYCHIEFTMNFATHFKHKQTDRSILLLIFILLKVVPSPKASCFAYNNACCRENEICYAFVQVFIFIKEKFYIKKIMLFPCYNGICVMFQTETEIKIC